MFCIFPKFVLVEILIFFSELFFTLNGYNLLIHIKLCTCLYHQLSYSIMFGIDLKYLKVSSLGKKRLFLLYGIANFLITNSILHLLLLVIPIFLATIISQITNLTIGFYLYGKKVFKMKNLTYQKFIKYTLLALFNWILNYVSIRLMYENGINKNLAAIFTIPFLILFSYSFQRKYIFIKPV